MDLGKLLSGIGQTMSGTAAGLQGDNDYFGRLQAQMDNAAERQRRTKLAEQELESREQDRAVNRSKNLLETLKLANDVAADVDGDPERAKLPSRIIKSALEQNLGGGKIDDAEMQEFMTKGSGAFDAIAGLYEGIVASGLDKNPAMRKAMKDKTISLKDVDAMGREKLSNVAFQAASELAKDDPEGVKKMTWGEFQKRIPQAKFTSEKDIYRLQELGYTIKPDSLVKKEKEEETKIVGEQRRDIIRDQNTAQSQAFQTEQQGRQIAAAEGRTQALIAAGNEKFAVGENRRQEQLDRQKGLDARLTPTETRELENSQKSLNLIDSYQQAHDELMKETGGKLPAVLKGALTKNATALTTAQITNVAGNTPASRRFAAAYNNIAANIRQTGNEPGVMTEGDAVRLLTSFNPAATPEQFRANVAERRATYVKNQKLSVENQKFRGKNIPPGLDPDAQAAQPMRNKSKTGKPIISTDGGKTWTYE